jgi:hypothetical protein
VTKRERLRRLEQRLALEPARRFLAVAGTEADVDREALARLPGEVTVILTGVPRNPDDAPGAARMAVSEWR